MTNVITKDLIYINEELNTQDEVFHFLANSIVEAKRAESVSKIIEGFYAREKEFSTAVNDKIAIPHCRIPEIHDATVIVVRNKKDIFWTDQESVNLFFALLIPENNVNDTHIRILAQVAQLILEDDFLEVIHNSSSSQDIFEKMNILNSIS